MFRGNKQGLKVLAAGTLLNLFLGTIYGWGIFVIPLTEHLNWDADSVKLTASFLIGFSTWGNILSGYLIPKLGTTKVIVIGGFTMAFGALLAGFTPAGFPWLIYFAYGVLVGLGGGMGYVIVVVAAQQWFPNHRGIATGICVGSFGLSVTVFAPIFSFLLREFSVRNVFFILAAIFLLINLLLARLMKFPEAKEAPSSSMDDRRQFTPKEMIRERAFCYIIISLFLATAGFFVVNPAVQTLSIYRGFDLAFATRLLMITGISNMAGRFLVPTISGRVRNEIIVAGLMAILALSAGTLTFATGPLFIVAVTLIPLCFGAALSVFPLLAGDYFGLKNLAANYSIIGLGFSFSALLSPGLIGLMGSYTAQFAAVSALSAIGLCIMSYLAYLKKTHL